MRALSRLNTKTKFIAYSNRIEVKKLTIMMAGLIAARDEKFIVSPLQNIWLAGAPSYSYTATAIQLPRCDRWLKLTHVSTNIQPFV